MKLHLGCGDKHIQGYLNVDKYDYEEGDASRLGSIYDVKADILKLPFKDNTIEEILMVHVLEHFYRWDTLDIMDTCYRLLKKGGRITIGPL